MLALTRPQARRRAGATFGAAASAILLLLQAGLGAAVVGTDLNAVVVTIHYANAMLLVAAVIFTTVAAYVDLRAYRPSGAHRAFARLALGVTIATFGLILIGTYVRARSAGLVFTDWPLMNGSLVPSFSIPLATIQFAHRLAALVVFVGVVMLVLRAVQREADRPPVRSHGDARRRRSSSSRPCSAPGSSGAGAATFFVVAHELTGSLVWGSLVTATLLAYRLAPASEPESLRRAVAARRRALVSAGEGGSLGLGDGGDGGGIDLGHPGDRGDGHAGFASIDLASFEDGAAGDGVDGDGSPQTDAGLGARFQAYVAMTKPHIIILLLITTVPAMVLAEDGWPSAWLILATLFGGTLSAAGANVINCYIDRDIDEVMRRTRRRAIPRHQVSPAAALTLGVCLGVAGFVFLAVVVNLLSAMLATAALLFYVFVYTLWMKRSSPQNIVIGGAAGAAPTLVGWAAVTGRVGLPAVVLFLIVFYWTPPHFWALSMRYEGDYRAAGVPMLPVVRGIPETTRQILLYSFVLFADHAPAVSRGTPGPAVPVGRAGPRARSSSGEALALRRERSVNRAPHRSIRTPTWRSSSRPWPRTPSALDPVAAPRRSSEERTTTDAVLRPRRLGGCADSQPRDGRRRRLAPDARPPRPRPPPDRGPRRESGRARSSATTWPPPGSLPRNRLRGSMRGRDRSGARSPRPGAASCSWPGPPWRS